MQLRPYQAQALADLDAYWAKGNKPLIVMPTGSGKSLVIADFIRTTIQDHPHVKVLVAVHTKELVQQDYDEFTALAPTISAGIYSTGLQRYDTACQVWFATIQSIHRKAHLFPADVLIVDEAHRIPSKQSTQYQRLIDDLRIRNPRLAVIGLTATPYRLDSGLLHEGDNAVFDGIAHSTPITTLIEEGYLAPLTSKGSSMTIDTSEVKTLAGDFHNGELQTAAREPSLTDHAVDDIITRGVDRNSWLVFATGIDHAHDIRQAFHKRNINAEVISKDTPRRQRDSLIQQFKEQRIKCLINVAVLTTGFNAPSTDLIALLTATKSASKYVQILGRGMRTAPGKKNCLVLDYGGNIERFGPVEAVNPLTKGADGRQRMPYKTCPSCYDHLPSGIRTCPACGHIFPRPDPDLYKQASALRPYGGIDPSKPTWVQVDDAIMCKHHKFGNPFAPASVRIDYLTEVGIVSKWLPLEHPNPHARKFAMRYIRQAGGDAKTVDTALAQSSFWNIPSHILIKRKDRSRYYNVMDFRFTQSKGINNDSSLSLSTQDKVEKYEKI